MAIGPGGGANASDRRQFVRSAMGARRALGYYAGSRDLAGNVRQLHSRAGSATMTALDARLDRTAQ